MATAGDDFNRADGAIGANWTGDSGSWNVASNLAVQRTTPAVYYKARYTATAPATNDYYSEAIVVSPSGATHGTGTCVRAQSGANTYYGYVFFGGDNSYLVEITAGVETILDTGDPVTAATNYTARLEANGTALTGTRGGAADVSATDATLTTGGWGLAAFAGQGSGVTQAWNDWIAADLAAPAVDVGFMTPMRGVWG